MSASATRRDRTVLLAAGLILLATLVTHALRDRLALYESGQSFRDELPPAE